MKTEEAPGQPLHFDVVLRPHRSLSPHGFYFLMAVISVVCFSAGVVFMLAGAWPVFGFLGLDVLAIYIAFRLSYRSGRLLETLQLSDEKLLVRRIHPDGRAQVWSAPPYWVRVSLELSAQGAGRLRLSSHGRWVAIGAFLTAEEREALAEGLHQALARARLAPHLR